MLIPGAEVLVRPRSCWCLPCLSVAMSGPGEETKLNSIYEVGGNGIGEPCDMMSLEKRPKFYTWRNESCRFKVSPQVAVREKHIKDRGHSLSNGLQVGMWVLVEAFGDEDDDMWLGKTVAFPDDDDVCAREHTTGQTFMYSTRFDKGDFTIAVQWYERSAECSDERREFIMGEPDISLASSSELRACGFQMDELGTRSMTRRNRESSERKWLLPRCVEADALMLCR